MSKEIRRRQLLGAGSVMTLGVLGVSAVRGQTDAWPNKPIRMMCGFQPGGLTDAYARAFGDALSAATRQPVTVDSRPGAGGFIALEALSRAAPDGYSLGVTTQGSVWASRALYRKVPFDADRDFVPISLLPSGALLLAVPADLPVSNVREWVDYGKKNKVSIGTYAPGSIPHMVAGNYARQYGMQIQAIHYKGESPMWVDVGTGNTQGGIGSYQGLAPYLSRGQLKAIAATGGARCPKLPNVPTFTEQGYDSAETRLDGWLPMIAPTGTPVEILQRVSDIVMQAAEGPKIKALLELYAIPDRPTSLTEAARRWKDESVQWVKLAQQLGITLD